MFDCVLSTRKPVQKGKQLLKYKEGDRSFQKYMLGMI